MRRSALPPPELGPEQAAARLDVPPKHLFELCRALGLRTGEDEALTSHDLLILHALVDLARAAGVDEAAAVLLARSFGHHTARLAMWQVLGLTERSNRGLEPRQAAERAEHLMQQTDAQGARLLVLLWRKQVEAVLDWHLRRGAEESHQLRLSVGFIDLCDYTRITRDLDGHAVAARVRAFESICMEVIFKHGGRLVKTLGDGVLYVADDVVAAVEISLELAQRIPAEGSLSEVRAGIATGEVTAILGDVHGSTVNRAHRLTQSAEPGTVAVDEATADAGGGGSLSWLRLPPSSLRGLGDVTSWRPTRPASA